MKYSRQREALLTLLKDTDTHPTAEWLYNELRKDFPNISLGTVYRNLNLLCKTGGIIKLDVGDGTEHYDAITNEHYHFVCKGCSSVIDVQLPLTVNLNEETQKHNDVLVHSNSLLFYGLCKHCK